MSTCRFRRFVVIALALALVPAGRWTALGAQQPDSARVESPATHVLRTRDGSTFIGRVIAEDSDSVRFLTIGGAIVVARMSITELRVLPARAVRHGEYWIPDPNDTRLLFAPTGRMLAKGDGYFSDTYLVFLNIVGGVTSRFTMGGGFSIIPSDNPQNNLVYITPKVGLVQSEKVNVAVGALAAFAGFERIDEPWRTLGIVYGVGTFGSPDASFTVGTGLAYTGNGLADRPIFMVGGSARAGRRVAFISENYVLPAAEDHVLITYGLRLFAEKLSVDLAFGNVIGSGSTAIVPGIPYVAVAVKF